MSNRAKLVERYADFAAATRGQSACFEAWANGVRADRAVLGWLETFPQAKQQPNLIFAAARWHGVPAPGPYADLRAALLTDDGPIRATVSERSTQTNEVGRVATLAPVFAALSARAGAPLALLEVGTSAGLGLYPDRYDYHWPGAGRLTGSGGPVLTCDVTGPMPVPTAPVPVGWRAGIDRHPLDVADADAMAWLETLVWPEQQQRRERLWQAIAVARRDPPRIIAGDLRERLPELVEEAAAHGEVVVFHSAVISYLDHSARAGFHALMADLVARRRCRWVSNEGRRVLPEVTATATRPAPAGLDFVLGLDGRALAWTHQHGAAMDWL